MIVPQEIRNRQFKNGLYGYSEKEVEEFLEQLSSEFEELYSGNERLKDRLRRMQSQIAVFKKTEPRLDRILELTGPRGERVEAESRLKAQELLETTSAHIEELLRSYRELLQRMECFTEEARMLCQIQLDEGCSPTQEEEDGSKLNRLDIINREMGFLSQYTKNHVESLEEYEKAIEISPDPKIPALTIESLMASFWEELVFSMEPEVTKSNLVEPDEAEPLPITEQFEFNQPSPPEPDLSESLMEESLPVPEERDDDIILNALKILQGEKNIEVQGFQPPSFPKVDVRSDPMDRYQYSNRPGDSYREWTPTAREASGSSTRGRIIWALVFAFVVVAGLFGGYIWSNDLASWTSIFGSDDPVSSPDKESESSARTGEGKAKANSPLLEATIEKDVDKVKELLASGASTEAANEKGETPLIVAAYQGDQEVVKALLNAGANPDVKEKEWGVSPLMYAAFQGHLEVVKILVNNDARLDLRNNQGWTALMCAAFAGRPQTVRFLLAEGADPYLENQDGWNAYELAVLAGRELTAKNMEDAGVNPSGVSKNSSSEFSADEKMLNMFSP